MKLLLNYFTIIISLFSLQNLALAETNTLENQPQKPPSVKIFPTNFQPETPEQKLAEADRLYLAGEKIAAEKLYREVKEPFSENIEAKINRPKPIYEPTELPITAQVYWRQAQAGLAKNIETQIFIALELLVKEYPEFIPAHIKLAEVLKADEQTELSLEILHQAASLYPNEPELMKAQITALANEKKWLEATLSAQQFALMNPEHSQVDEFNQLAETHRKKFQSQLKSKLRGNTIANVVTGALGVALTGNPFAALNAVQTTALMLRGESKIGKSLAKSATKSLPMVEDEAIFEYVNTIGQKLAKMTGRNDFEYQFYIINDENLNAFALPGGQIFINLGAIVKTNSEAELAGLLAHELAHTVLSHGFQLMSEGNLISSVTQYIPYAGGVVSNLIVLNYSREMERQADVLGTRILVSADYAADGVRNLMKTLNEDKEDRGIIAWLSTHPETAERVRYLEELIINSGYNRYAYEGVIYHAKIKEKAKALLVEKKKDFSEI
ncbi:MAG: M48 family metalloprotease [Okeania sp. SIO3B5]|uniref:M48 family metallopeptidase n=1 Tax=Okeania sp. SIO3B5 TaxID=2607811 RepID=UPI0013FF3C31|nr:M48 family metallopeptidase [Okeania sp. SIO3B5]NEO55464.1 M48 family metalloprotease [Okeania sp. SIO3B5]